MMSDYANVPAESAHRQKPEVRGLLLYFCSTSGSPAASK
jgi:hypothetical protein